MQGSCVSLTPPFLLKLSKHMVSWLIGVCNTHSLLNLCSLAHMSKHPQLTIWDWTPMWELALEKLIHSPLAATDDPVASLLGLGPCRVSSVHVACGGAVTPVLSAKPYCWDFVDAFSMPRLGDSV